MIFRETEIDGVVVVEPEHAEDERGSFARTFDAEEWHRHGLAPAVAQCNLSRNPRRGTLRGLHYQAAPYGEAKLVRCSRGTIFDVALDLRPGSATYCRWVGVELDGASARMLHVPKGCAHGFVTLEDDCELVYLMSAAQVPDAARGVRWDDPAFGIEWPLEPRVISERDRTYADFRP